MLSQTSVDLAIENAAGFAMTGIVKRMQPRPVLAGPLVDRDSLCPACRI
jgi:hypothetical protein